MSKEQDLKFFEASIDFFRKKTLEKITAGGSNCRQNPAFLFLIATHTPEDTSNAFKYGMLSVVTEGTGKGYGAEKALEILVLLGTLGRSLYHLGLAYDLALKSDKSQWEIDHILGQLSRLKS